MGHLTLLELSNPQIEILNDRDYLEAGEEIEAQCTPIAEISWFH